MIKKVKHLLLYTKDLYTLKKESIASIIYYSF